MSGVSVELTVPFHDVDVLHVVWHGHYYKYFELARTELMKAHGLDVPDLIALGRKMMVVESHCRYMRPLHYGERFTVSARFAEVDHRIVITYEVRSVTHARRVARGRTALVTLSPEGELLLDTPEDIRLRIVGRVP